MSIHRASLSIAFVSALTSVTFFATAAYGQSSAGQPASADKQIAQIQSGTSGKTDTKAVPAVTPAAGDLQSEVTALKAENAVVRELLQKMEEQQKTLLEQVNQLQRRLDGGFATDLQPTGQPQVLMASAKSSDRQRMELMSPCQQPMRQTRPHSRRPARRSKPRKTVIRTVS